MKVIFDASPMIVEQTGIAFYTERLAVSLARKYPDMDLRGFYYNFLGRRDTSHLPRSKNLGYMHASLVPSKIVYQLRRWGIEFPIEALSLTPRADFILYPNILGYPSLFRTPSACVIHDLTYIDLPEYVSAKLRSDLVRFVPKQIKRSSFIITVSEFTKQRIVDYYHVDPASVIVTPIPPEPVTPAGAGAGQAVLQGLGITKPYILFVGTIEPRKNIPNLIDGFLALPKELQQQYQLVIAGRIGWNCDQEVAKLQAARENGAPVVHLGYVTNEAKDTLYRNATVFSSASHYEGFGMPVLEAMNHGIPCALSNIPVFTEVASDAADYFNEQDPADIARVFASLLHDEAKRHRLGEKARSHVSTYSWDRVAASVHDAIQAHIR